MPLWPWECSQVWQPSGPSLQWTFPQKTASLPMTDKVTCHPGHFPGCLVGQDLDHNTLSQHPYDYKLSASLDWRGGWGGKGKRLENTHRLSVWIHGGLSLRRRCFFTLCESPSDPELTNHLCSVNASSPVWEGLVPLFNSHFKFSLSACQFCLCFLELQLITSPLWLCAS